MAKKRIDVSNRLSYTIIAFVVLILLGAGVYAATGWTSNQPSHDTLWAQIIKGKDVDTIDIVDTNLNITSSVIDIEYRYYYSSQVSDAQTPRCPCDNGFGQECVSSSLWFSSSTGNPCYDQITVYSCKGRQDPYDPACYYIPDEKNCVGAECVWESHILSDKLQRAESRIVFSGIGGTLNAANSIITPLISASEIIADTINTNEITADYVSTNNFIYNRQRTDIFDKILFPSNDVTMIVSSKIISSSSDNSPYVTGYVEGAVTNDESGDHIVGSLPVGYDGTRCITFLQGFSDTGCTNAFTDCKYLSDKYKYGGLAVCWLGGAGDNIIYGSYSGGREYVGDPNGYVRCGYLCW